VAMRNQSTKRTENFKLVPGMGVEPTNPYKAKPLENADLFDCY
jgi:hypothetical protein